VAFYHPPEKMAKMKPPPEVLGGEYFGFAERFRSPAFLFRLRRNCGSSARTEPGSIRLEAVEMIE